MTGETDCSVLVPDPAIHSDEENPVRVFDSGKRAVEYGMEEYGDASLFRTVNAADMRD